MGKEQIHQLVSDAIDKYEKDTGEKVVCNQNPDNYKGLANKLCEISKRLPVDYLKDFEPDTGGKYDITTAQIRDALFGKVEKIKVHFNEALHLYIYGKRSVEVSSIKRPDQEPSTDTGNQKELIRQKAVFRKKYATLIVISAILFIACLLFVFKWLAISHDFKGVKHQFDSVTNQCDTIKKYMRILPYYPTQPQIDMVEGIYMVYTGSPQARKSDTNRYHMVVPCIVKVNYNKKGYFEFDRYGPKINQDGWMQFEDSNIISIHSNYINPLTKERSVPKLALMRLEKGKDTFNIISTSWTWDSNPEYNVMIGIREVFIKLGKGGEIEDVSNTLRYHDLPGTTLHWKNDKVDTVINLQNVRLETLQKHLQPLLDENSIMAKDPDSRLILKQDPRKSR